ncbi:MAG: NAD-dependent epimerase/dehydratase family protein [Candidatus Pelagibacterales bacterium]|jgi:nucleoside-diphosphate-sugar epimerase|tara:strand:- start:4193 stop:5032 length:840 start_codon:yes stop_codon:yes gene_type:complete
MKKLLIYGYGYTASHLTNYLDQSEYSIVGSTRNIKKLNNDNNNIELIRDNEVSQFLIDESISHLLISAPPSIDGDPFVNNHVNFLTQNKKLEWIGYLSATNVYGDHEGNFVNELSQTNPTTKKGINRLKAEKQWLELSSRYNLPLKIFRLAGIYGQDRNILKRINLGSIKNIDKPGQFFSRIHIEDIISILSLSMKKQTPNIIYNFSDDYPSSLSQVIDYICKIKNLPILQKINFDKLDPLYKNESFFSENKRVDNSLVKKDFQILLKYPSYKEGYKDL